MKDSARPSATHRERGSDLVRGAKPAAKSIAHRESSAGHDALALDELEAPLPCLLDRCIRHERPEPASDTRAANRRRLPRRPARAPLAARIEHSHHGATSGGSTSRRLSSAFQIPSIAAPPLRRMRRPSARGPPAGRDDSLETAWSSVIESSGQPLPRRVELERLFGRQLGHVRVHADAGARRLLDRLGARGAERDGHILLRNPALQPTTLVHELVHALQPRCDAYSPTGVAAAEREAEHATRDILWHGRRPLLRAALPRGRFALRREAEELDIPPKVVERKPRVPRAKKDEAKATRKKTVQTKVAAIVPKKRPKKKPKDEQTEPKADEKKDGEPKPGETEQGELDAGKEGEQEEAEGRRRKGLPRSTVNRAKDLRKLAEASQQTFGEGKKKAEDHELDPASDAAVPEDNHPFARGPPFEVPERSEEPMPRDDPTRELVPGEDREAAGDNVFATLEQIRRREQALVKADDEENAANRKAKAKEVDEAIETEFGKHTIDKLDTPKLVLEGDDEATRGKKAKEEIAKALDDNQTLERERSKEDYGEKVLGPTRDPTAGHDVGLERLELPEVDVLSRAPEDLLARVATEDNVGQVAVDDLLLVRDEPFDEAEATKPLHEQARKQIETELAGGDRSLTDLGKVATKQRDAQFEAAARDVGDMRTKWQGEIDDHVATRRKESDEFAKTKIDHATKLREDAEKDAKATIDGANADADQRWKDAHAKAEDKAQESESKSWWEKGLDWVASAIKKLTKWLGDFIRACKKAIDALLEAARDLAHDIIDAARDAIVATFDVIKAGFDWMADNLPGELGDMAKRWRDSAYEYLDGAQSKLDEWADDLHDKVDDTIDGIREKVDGALDGLADAIETTGVMIADLLTMGLMPWLRKYFPEVAQLVDEGLIAPVKWAAGTLEGWLDTILESTGLAKVKRAIEGVEEDKDLCMGKTAEEREADCKAFERLLEGLLDRFDRLLKHPIALKIKEYLQKKRDEEAAKQVDSVSSFFDFIGQIAKPIAKWWDRITSAIGAVVDVLKKVAGTIWRQLATALGIDPDIDPIEALKEGIQALWDTAVQAVQPIIDAIKDAWTWLTEKSPLAGIIDFIGRLPELWTELGKLWDKIKNGVGDWLASAAQWLRDTFIPPIEAVLGTIGEVLGGVVDTLSSWGEGLLSALDSLLGWTSTWQVIDFLAEILKTLVRPIRFAIKVFCDCVLKALRWIADNIKNLLSYLRTFLDICVGIAVAMLLGPIGIAAFFAGAIWLYLVPHCYKGPILNFLLDVTIKFIEFFPEPADFVLAAIYQGTLSFLRTIRQAPDETKIKAVDLVASIFAGNLEVAAGVAVGLVKGVWESTGGTIIFLLEIVAWLVTLPFKLIGWAADLISGKSDEQDPDEVAEPEGGTAPPVDAGVGAGVGAGEVDAEEVLVRVRAARGPPTGVNTPSADAQDEQVDEQDEQDADTDQATDTPESTAEEDLEVEEDLEEDEADDESEGESSSESGSENDASDEHDENEPEPEIVESETDEADTNAEAEPESDEADQTPESDEPENDEPETDEQTTETPTDTPTVDSPTVDEPPATPQELPQLSDVLSKLVNEGFSKDEIRGLLDSLRAQLTTFVGGIAEQAAKQLLESLTAKGSAYSIGEVIGTILGMIIVEVVLAILTAGGSTAITAAKTALSGVKLAGRLGQAFAKIKKAITPLLELLSKLKKTVGAIVGKVQKWLDDVFAWIKGIFKRKPKIRGPPKVKKPTVPKPKKPTKKPSKKPTKKPSKKPSKKPTKKPSKKPTKKPSKKPKKTKTKNKKKKKKKKKNDPLSILARRAVRAAWQNARTHAGTKVIREKQMRRVIKSTRVKRKPGIRVAVGFVHKPGSHKWRAKATVREGTKTARARSRPGWVAYDEKKALWVAAARNQKRTHESAIADADRRIEAKVLEFNKEAKGKGKGKGKKGKAAPTHKELHKWLEPKVREIETKPHPKLLGGISMNIHESEYKLGKDEKRRPAFLYKVQIGPNTTTETITVTAELDPPETEIHHDPVDALGRANHVWADPLTSKPDKRYIPSSSTGPVYQEALLKKWIKTNTYMVKNPLTGLHDKEITGSLTGILVKAHLLSEQLQGPAVVWNLANASHDSNQKMRSGPEDTGKRNKDQTLSYDVKVAYHSNTDPGALANKDDLTEAQIREVVGAYIAKSLTVTITNKSTNTNLYGPKPIPSEIPPLKNEARKRVFTDRQTKLISLVKAQKAAGKSTTFDDLTSAWATTYTKTEDRASRVTIYRDAVAIQAILAEWGTETPPDPVMKQWFADAKLLFPL